MANHRINSLGPAVVIADFCNKIGQQPTFGCSVVFQE